MNKNDLIAAVAEKTGLTKAQAGEAVDAALDAITGTLKSGGEVRIIGFGNFSVSERAASEGRNPRTGETIQIPASNNNQYRLPMNSVRSNQLAPSELKSREMKFEIAKASGPFCGFQIDLDYEHGIKPCDLEDRSNTFL